MLGCSTQVFGLTSLRTCILSTDDDSVPATVHQLVSTFSSDPSLNAFAQLCCDLSWDSRQVVAFQLNHFYTIIYEV